MNESQLILIKPEIKSWMKIFLPRDGTRVVLCFCWCLVGINIDYHMYTPETSHTKPPPLPSVPNIVQSPPVWRGESGVPATDPLLEDGVRQSSEFPYTLVARSNYIISISAPNQQADVPLSAILAQIFIIKRTSNLSPYSVISISPHTVFYLPKLPPVSGL